MDNILKTLILHHCRYGGIIGMGAEIDGESEGGLECAEKDRRAAGCALRNPTGFCDQSRLCSSAKLHR